MKYIHQIDSYESKALVEPGLWVIARPNQGYGLLWLKIRILMAWACLTGKADAVTFFKQ